MSPDSSNLESMGDSRNRPRRRQLLLLLLLSDLILVTSVKSVGLSRTPTAPPFHPCKALSIPVTLSVPGMLPGRFQGLV